MKKIIFDCDNTMGEPGCDIDDGMALLYLLGLSDEAELLGITTTFGNSTIEVVNRRTHELIEELACPIPVYEGVDAPDAYDATDAASAFLAEAVAAEPGEITIIATGSMTNLKNAALRDECFFGQVKEIFLMGGYTDKLVVGDKVVDELNLSSDPDAALQVLNAPCRVTSATAQHCLPAYFRTSEFNLRLRDESKPDGGPAFRLSQDWFERMTNDYGIEGFVCWDVVAAAMALHPELFRDETREVILDRKFLEHGMLETPSTAQAIGNPTIMIHTPVIIDAPEFCEHVYEAWRRESNRSPF